MMTLGFAMLISLPVGSVALALRQRSLVGQHLTGIVEPEYDVTGDEWKKMVTDQGLEQLDKAHLQMNTSKGNLCTGGKLLPRLYLLGAQKSATTSLAWDLMMAGIKSAAGDKKEWGFFEYENAVTRRKFLRALPSCPDSGSHVLADFTPNNFRMTKLPDHVKLYRGWPGAGDASGNDPGGDGSGSDRPLTPAQLLKLPQRLQDFYHDEHKSRLVFVTLLREPLSRMQSAWYGLRNPPIRQGRRSFSDDVNVTLNYWKTSSGHSLLDWMWRSMYAPALDKYLLHFSPSQFVVVPMKQYTEDSQEIVVDTILQRLEVSRGKPSGDNGWVNPGGSSNRMNQGEHPHLEDDIDPEVRAEFNQEMKQYNDQLVRLLLKMYNQDAILIGMNQKKPSEEDVRDWLYRNW